MALVRCERRDDGVALVTFDNPKVNAMSTTLLYELRDIAEALRIDPPGSIVVTGEGRNFAAGADISELGQGTASGLAVGRAFRASIDALEMIPRVTIAAINGFALGGGLEVALGCDFRLASDSAGLGFPEILLGIIPGGGGTQRLARLVGQQVARQMIYTGRQLDAEEAFEIGLVDEVVPANDLLDVALERAAAFSRGPVTAHGKAKRAIIEGLSGSLPSGLDLEHRLFADVFDTEDASIGIESFLANGPGKAEFVGR